MQAGTVIEDEVQNELMVLAIEEVGQAVVSQPAVPVPTGKAAVKAGGGKSKKDEPKPLQVRITCQLCAV